MRIRLAVFDVDGTLRDRDGMPESAREALWKLKKEGISIALATGRSEYEMRAFMEELEIDWAITCNGSHVGYRGKTIISAAFPHSVVQQWVETAERLGHELLLFGAEGMFLNRGDAPLFRKAQQEIGMMEPLIFRSADDLPAIYLCNVFCTPEEEEAYKEAAADGVYVHRWSPCAVDFCPFGTNKAAGLSKLLEYLKIKPGEVAAFGDSSNDLEMMELVGTAIVMGNGTDELKKKATHVTKPLHDGGIAYAVDRWILETKSRLK